ncbi:MAG: InlB B-repeat-containing protein, partial [Candidatus Ancillula sp.]|nr:InlB B-repeat-containing protein [Candidatus Ancillula sp.]
MIDFYSNLNDKDGIISRNLKGGSGLSSDGQNYNGDDVAGPDVDNQYVWSLSVNEAKQLKISVLDYNPYSSYWLRSSGENDNSASTVSTYTGFAGNIFGLSDSSDVAVQRDFRPAMYLSTTKLNSLYISNLESVNLGTCPKVPQITTGDYTWDVIGYNNSSFSDLPTGENGATSDLNDSATLILSSSSKKKFSMSEEWAKKICIDGQAGYCYNYEYMNNDYLDSNAEDVMEEAYITAEASLTNNSIDVLPVNLTDVTASGESLSKQMFWPISRKQYEKTNFQAAVYPVEYFTRTRIGPAVFCPSPGSPQNIEENSQDSISYLNASTYSDCAHFDPTEPYDGQYKESAAIRPAFSTSLSNETIRQIIKISNNDSVSGNIFDNKNYFPDKITSFSFNQTNVTIQKGSQFSFSVENVLPAVQGTRNLNSQISIGVDVAGDSSCGSNNMSDLELVNCIVAEEEVGYYSWSSSSVGGEGSDLNVAIIENLIECPEGQNFVSEGVCAGSVPTVPFVSVIPKCFDMNSEEIVNCANPINFNNDGNSKNFTLPNLDNQDLILQHIELSRNCNMNYNDSSVYQRDCDNAYDDSGNDRVYVPGQNDGALFWNTDGTVSIFLDSSSTGYAWQDIAFYYKDVTPSQQKYKATFMNNGGVYVEEPNLLAGGKLSEPTKPTREGYTFGGWFKDSGFSQAWDFANDTVSGNVILYAKWIQNAIPDVPGTPDTPDRPSVVCSSFQHKIGNACVENGVTSLLINKGNLTLTANADKNKTYQLRVTPMSSFGALQQSDQKVSYSSNNKTVAKVSSTGKITALKVGIATITAKTINGKAVKCKVTVELPLTTKYKSQLKDIKTQNKTFQGYIKWMFDYGVTTGDGKGHYLPNNLVRRDQMAMFIYRLMGSPDYTNKVKNFSDVKKNAGSYQS